MACKAAICNRSVILMPLGHSRPVSWIQDPESKKWQLGPADADATWEMQRSLKSQLVHLTLRGWERVVRSRRTTLCINALKSPGHEHKGCKRVLKSCQVLGSNLPGMKGICWHVCTVSAFKLYWVNSKANAMEAGSMTYTEKNSKNYIYFKGSILTMMMEMK